MTKPIGIHIQTIRDPQRAGRAARSLARLLCPEAYALNVEAQSVLAESARFLSDSHAESTSAEAARQQKIAQLKAELARLEGAA